MKLMRFTAESTHKAMLKVHAALGSAALIHATNTLEDGVEIIASSDQEIQEETTKVTELDILKTIQQNWESLRLEIENLKKQIDQQSWMDALDDSPADQRYIINTHLQKLGFSQNFRQPFIDTFLKTIKRGGTPRKNQINKALEKMLILEEYELIDDNLICALVGPTGAGKTTTITKLAKRYVEKHGHETLGVITTDYRDVSLSNQLLNYCHYQNIDLEYVNDANELSVALCEMRKKNLILIDTGGVNPRDSAKISVLLNLFALKDYKIRTYLTLPATTQENVLHALCNSFKKGFLSGCIITKEDEADHILPVLSVSMLHKLAIAYITNGQDLTKHIYFPEKEILVKHVNFIKPEVHHDNA
jgi:flagellar biosynthesis protein FlhF